MMNRFLRNPSNSVDASDSAIAFSRTKRPVVGWFSGFLAGLGLPVLLYEEPEMEEPEAESLQTHWAAVGRYLEHASRRAYGR
jgi:hypothetical protein